MLCTRRYCAAGKIGGNTVVTRSCVAQLAIAIDAIINQKAVDQGSDDHDKKCL